MSKTKVILEVSNTGGELSIHKMTQAGMSMLLNGAFPCDELWTREDIEERRPELSQRGFADGITEGWYEGQYVGGLMPLMGDRLSADIVIDDDIVEFGYEFEEMTCIWDEELEVDYEDELAPDDKVPDELEPVWFMSTYEKAYGNWELKLDEEFDKSRVVYAQLSTPIGVYVTHILYRKKDNTFVEFECHNGFGDGETKGTSWQLCYKYKQDDWTFDNQYMPTIDFDSVRVGFDWKK